MKNLLLFFFLSSTPTLYPLMPSDGLQRKNNEAPVLQITGNKDVERLKKEFKKEKPNIFVDFHGVLVTKSWRNGIFKIGQDVEGVKKLQLLGELFHALFNWRVYKGLWELGLRLPFMQQPKWGKNKITESYFNMLGALGYTLLREELIRFSNNIFVTNPQMGDLLKRLVENGCTLHFFSNIGASTFDDAKERKLFCEVLDYFNQGNVINNSTETAYSLWKPQGQAFEAALEKTGATPDNALMIDDKPANLPTDLGIAKSQKKAQKNGISYTAPTKWAAGILYNKRHHQAVVAALDSLGLLEK